MNLHFILMNSALDFGITVAIVGFGIVLFSLLLLFVLFSRIPKLINMKFKRRKGQEGKDEKAIGDDHEMEGNVTAAISLALHRYFSELHDEESNVVTIKQVRKTYSPWSSKIYSVTHNWPKN